MGIWKPTLIICSTKRTFVSTKEFKGAFRQKKKAIEFLNQSQIKFFKHKVTFDAPRRKYFTILEV